MFVWLLSSVRGQTLSPETSATCQALEGSNSRPGGSLLPQPRTLPFCAEYETCTCCSAQHARSILRTIISGVKPAVCQRACDGWYASCKDDFFEQDQLGGQIRPCSEEAVALFAGGNGENICGLSVSRTGGFQRHPIQRLRVFTPQSRIYGRLSTSATAGLQVELDRQFAASRHLYGCKSASGPAHCLFVLQKPKRSLQDLDANSREYVD
ncbi:hypothetical protein WJX74_000231 [Apatococcus lobatus]|uniref:Folate receptor-like domain-containing protein n=1 Tax=Apatococcus lobatus TaxID=904363 RepID=A0AAW1SF50_9CHLO